MEKIYNKLVRDKIPEIIIDDGKKPITSRVKNKEHLRKLLLDKLFEEVKEYQEEYCLEELADIMEVIYALIEVVEDAKIADVENLRVEKANSRGAFRKGIILEKVIYS